MGLSFRSAEERAQFAERLAQGRDEDASREEQRTANRDFSQVYPKGWTRIRALLNESKSRAPLLLYTFIAEHMDADGGALVVDQETLCEALGVSRTTLWRAITFLEERNALLRERGRIGFGLCFGPDRDLEKLGPRKGKGCFPHENSCSQERRERRCEAPDAAYAIRRAARTAPR